MHGVGFNIDLWNKIMNEHMRLLDNESEQKDNLIP